MSSLSIQFAKLPKGLKHLNLSKTSLSPKGTVCMMCFILCLRLLYLLLLTSYYSAMLLIKMDELYYDGSFKVKILYNSNLII